MMAAERHHTAWNVGRFLLLTVATLAALSLTAVFVPARLKLLGLFPMMLGAAAGAIVTYLGQSLAASRRTILAVALALIPLALAGYAAGAFFAWRQARASEIVENLLAQPGGRQMVERLHATEPSADEVEAELLAAYREQMNPPPQRYLIERLRGMKASISLRGAALVAALEYLLGVMAALGTALFLSNRTVATTQHPPPQRD
jgi:hypothetical protein